MDVHFCLPNDYGLYTKYITQQKYLPIYFFFSNAATLASKACCRLSMVLFPS